MNESAMEAANALADMVEGRVMRSARVLREESKHDHKKLLENTVLPAISKMNINTALIAGGAAIVGAIVGGAIATYANSKNDEDDDYGYHG